MRNSCEGALQIPARGKTVFLIKAIAIEPEALAVAGLHPEIVAGRSFFTPPFHGDALRTFGPFDIMAALSPAEKFRRSVRRQGKTCFDRFRFFQKPQGPLW